MHSDIVALMSPEDERGPETIEWAVSRGLRVIVPPSLILERQAIVLGRRIVDAPSTLFTVDRSPRAWASEDWEVGFFSSGSTNHPKLVCHSWSQLCYTADQYKFLYGVTRHSHILSAHVGTYSFAFIAAILTAVRAGCGFTLDNTKLIKNVVYRMCNSSEIDKLIIIGNPLLFQDLSSCKKPSGLCVMGDSGGAPMSRVSLRQLHERGWDVREGYGPSEAASLTHFDTEGTASSSGTVGKPLPGVREFARNTVAGQILVMQAPNIGCSFSLRGHSVSPWGMVDSGDYVSWDEAGRLRVCGREGDYPVNGIWPRDIVDFLGQHFGVISAAINLPGEDEVFVGLSEGALSESNQRQEMERMREGLVKFVNIESNRIHIRVQKKLHTGKLTLWKSQ